MARILEQKLSLANCGGAGVSPAILQVKGNLGDLPGFHVGDDLGAPHAGSACGIFDLVVIIFCQPTGLVARSRNNPHA